MGLGTVIAAPPIRRGTSRPFQRALENLSTTSGGFKTFTLKISWLWFMVYGLGRPKPRSFYVSRPETGLNLATRWSQGLQICQNMFKLSFGVIYTF